MYEYDENIAKRPDCPKVDCKKKRDKCCPSFRKVTIPAVLGDDSPTSKVAPKNGAYCDALVTYEANGNNYIYSSDGIPTLIIDSAKIDKEIKEIQGDVGTLQEELAEEKVVRKEADDKLAQDLSDEITNRENADAELNQKIEDIKNSPDVVDIVDTKADLDNYDTSGLSEKDVIRVLNDETKENASTYYRWENGVWNYIGMTGPYYTKAETDALLNEKQGVLVAGDNIEINGNTISAIDTTYTAGDGLALNGTQFSADTDVLATKDDLANKVDVSELDNYYTKTDIGDLLDTKQDVLTAGNNITITNNVISANINEINSTDWSALWQ